MGGTTPKEDIIVDGKKLQVKTQFPHEVILKNVECFSSPTINKNNFDYVDYIVLVIVRDKELLTSDSYIFGKGEFEHFSRVGCWSGESKGDKTIYCIQEIKGELTESAKKIVKKYHKPEYRDLFEHSKDNWKKIKRSE